MKKECRFSYNDVEDSLIISCREDNENIRENFAFDNFIIYLTGKGKIVGLQVRNASKVLSESGANSNILKDIKSVNLIVAKKENCLVMAIGIISNSQVANIPLHILLPEIKATSQ